MKQLDTKLLIYTILFALTIFLQCVLFQWRMTGTFILSSLWNNPAEFFAFYMSKIAISLFISSFILLFRRKYWTLYVSIFINIWIFVELIYYRAYGFVLDASTMLIAHNMQGFWNSVYMYFMPADIVLILPTIFLFPILFYSNSTEKNKMIMVVLIVCAFICETIGMFSFHRAYRTVNGNNVGTQFEEYNEMLIPYDEYHFNPFTRRAFYGMYDISNVQITSEKYIRYHSVIHHFIFNIKENINAWINGSATFTLSNNDRKKAVQLCFNPPKDVEPNSKLIICLIESWETWVLHPYIMPNLFSFIESHESIFYATKIKRQIKAGGSADGQMIINTGLLPLNEGAACFNYPNNVYPSLSDCYDVSVGLFPHDLTVWNQNKMSAAYSIKDNIQTKSTDKAIMTTLLEVVEGYDYVMALTFSTHNPFEGYVYSKLSIPKGMPELMARYIMANNYLDDCMADFLQAIDDNEDLKDATIVFVGDHTVFYPEQRQSFAKYCQSNKLDYDVMDDYGPLIIYSPFVEQKEKYEDLAYQMDVYPTILSTIGCDEYYWKGVGVNLRDTIARHNRKISVIEAHDLSDKLIRSNFFKEYLEQN